VDRDKGVSDEVKRHRREALDAGLDALVAAAAGGDETGAARELEALKALGLLVPGESGALRAAPDVAG